MEAERAIHFLRSDVAELVLKTLPSLAGDGGVSLI
jgi:hypothetical protein